MITLPRTTMLSRGRLRAFWLAVWLLFAALAGVLGWSVGGRRGRPLLATAVTAGGISGLVWPSVARWPYRGWNYGARRLGGLACRYTTWVAHTTAFTPMDPPGLGNVPQADRASRWSSRETQGADAYSSASDDPAHRSDRQSPLRVVYRWVRDTERPRGRWLVACLALLRWVQPPASSEDQPSRPTDTYTLY